MRRTGSGPRGTAPRIWTPLDSITPAAVCAVLAAEDFTFFEHGTTDPLMRSRVLRHALRGDFTHGGSTIAQQLARNLFLGPERSLWRKAREFILARELTRRLSKERQLELYLNLVEWGPGTWGIGTASRHWFRKAPASLTPSEAVLLATILPSPRRGLQYAARPETLALRGRVTRRLWTARLVDDLGRSATAARLDRWATHVNRGISPGSALALVELELGRESRGDTVAPERGSWSRRCRPRR